MAESDHTPSIDDDTVKKYRVKILQRNRLIKNVTGLSIELFDEMTFAQLEVKLELLEQKYKAFENVQSELEYNDESQFEADHRDTFEEAYCIAKSKILNKLSLQKTMPLSSTQIIQHESMSRPKVNLPKLQLPTFNGIQSEWLDFYNMFSVLVDKNADISDIEKFQYLRSCLEGDAAKLIQSLEVTVFNYSKALDLLVSRYDNKRYIFNSHLQAIFKIQNILNPSVLQVRNFVDNINCNLRALQSIASKQQISDGVILHLIVSKLDSETATKWEEEVSNNSKQDTTGSFYLPTWDELATFLERRCQTFDIIATNNTSSRINQLSRKQTSFVVAGNQRCNLCDQPDSHNPFKCIPFMKLDPIGRYELIKRKGLCLNCLAPNHISNHCPSNNRCQHCRVSHHTLLHREKQRQVISTQENANTDEVGEQYNTPTVLKVIKNQSEVILATALVELSTASGKKMIARALLDSASQLHFISERAAQILHLSRQKADIDISGIGANTVKAYYHSSFTIKSMQYAQMCSVDAIILPAITTCQPHHYIDIQHWKIPPNIKLADPNFNKPSKVDLLIGTSVFYELLMVGQIKLQDNLPILQKTSLGWIVAGALSSIKQSLSPPLKASVLATNLYNLDETLEKFWLMENNYEVSKNNLNIEEQECENYFQKTTTRCAETNKFIVRLSFKSNPRKLGESYNIAFKRFLLLEKRLRQSGDLQKEYSDFIKEYIDMGHMKLAPKNLITSKSLNFIPHHCVTKGDSSTTRLRVVFDASCKTSNGVSLNENLRIGPTLQDDLFTILFRFRLHRYVLMADIAKMFRQIYIHPEDMKFQCILWRNSSNESINVYQLETVTYGTSCATYLAVKCMQQLAKDNISAFPIGAAVTLRDFYVDNLMTGAQSIDEVIEIKNQVMQLLQKGGFPLRKFASNIPQIIDDVKLEDREKIIQLQDSEYIKALGLKWSPNEDEFLFSYEAPTPSPKLTKRKILSHIASFYDPLGLINPIIVSCKILMQDLWKIKVNWDESVPQSIASQWEAIYKQLPQITQIRIQRFVHFDNNTEIHAFSDASTKAYGACIYAVYRRDGVKMSSLLCAKSRVAPVKSVTLPRLELSAALLLANLLEVVCKIINPDSNKVHCWSDSSITLAWISGDSSRWTQFVANRVRKIQASTTNFNWHYCPTVHNPADLVSRGIKVEDLIGNKLWFEGPEFLKNSSNLWPQLSPSYDEDPPEQKQQVTSLLANFSPGIFVDFKYINNYSKTIRIFAYITRFFDLLRKQKDVNVGPITVDEETRALLLICVAIQRETFPDEYKSLTKNNIVNRNSKLVQLSPFLKDGIIRVGGRLTNSSLSFDTIHPIVLPSQHPFIRALIEHFHRIHMHAGTQTLNSLLRDRFWIINARNTIRQTIHKCITCFRCRPKITQQIMGSLPKDRIEPTYPFAVTGVDYCSPFLITHRLRGKQPSKVYIAVFICFVTKAVHMELAMDLTTASFTAALKRFISRRGKCNTIYSDNATNFVGANRELKSLLQHFLTPSHVTAVDEYCKQQGINWKFIPPRSPHFGGLWESAVKQAKYFLRRAVGNYTFTYDELQTVCCQSEAVINSRPLTPMSSDPDDLRALTPSHF